MNLLYIVSFLPGVGLLLKSIYCMQIKQFTLSEQSVVEAIHKTNIKFCMHLNEKRIRKLAEKNNLNNKQVNGVLTVSIKRRFMLLLLSSNTTVNILCS